MIIHFNFRLSLILLQLISQVFSMPAIADERPCDLAKTHRLETVLRKASGRKKLSIRAMHLEKEMARSGIPAADLATIQKKSLSYSEFIQKYKSASPPLGVRPQAGIPVAENQPVLLGLASTTYDATRRLTGFAHYSDIEKVFQQQGYRGVSAANPEEFIPQLIKTKRPTYILIPGTLKDGTRTTEEVKLLIRYQMRHPGLRFVFGAYDAVPGVNGYSMLSESRDAAEDLVKALSQ